MDFLTVPVVIESIRKKAEQGNFCYTRVSDSYYEAIVHWGIDAMLGESNSIGFSILLKLVRLCLLLFGRYFLKEIKC